MKIKQLAGVGVLVILVSGTLLLGVVRSKTPGSSGRLLVTATYYPLYDFAMAIGGDKVEVSNITPPGAEPHDYEATPKQLAQAQDAQVFIYNGAHLEPWADNFLQDYKHVIVRASRNIDIDSLADQANPSKKVQDPHFWLDPVLAQTMVDNVRDGLIQADPTHKAFFYDRADSYKAQLAALDQAFRTGLASCQTREVVSAHQAFGYLAKRYNLKVTAIAGLSAQEEPSPARLADLAKLVRAKHIHYIFFESLTSPALAKALARETGAQTAVFDPIEGLNHETQAKNYLSLQYDNLAQLRTALACQ